MKKYIFYFILLSLFTGCKTYEAFLPSSPPVQPFFPERTKISYFGAPPLMFPQIKTIDEIEISTQYFKIAVPLVLDRSGKLEGIKNLIDEQFTTALDETKRFTVMDKRAMLNVMQQQYSTNLYITQDVEQNKTESQINTITQKGKGVQDIEIKGNNATISDSTNKSIIQRSNPSVSDYYGYFETNPDIYEGFLQALSEYTDGILKIVITGNDDKNKQIDIDYRIISSLSNNYILYSGKGKIGYLLEKGSATKSLNRGDIEVIVADIKQKFPNPDEKTWKIIQIRDKNSTRKITVNAGRFDNIKEGMVGYIVREDGERTAYRAVFVVTEVFDEAFNAELFVEPLTKLKDKGVLEPEHSQYFNIINTIRVGELVRMK